MSAREYELVDGDPPITGPEVLTDNGPLAIAAFAAWYWAKLVSSFNRVAEDARRWLADEAVLRRSAIEHHARVKDHLEAQAEHQDEVVRLLDETAAANRARA